MTEETRARLLKACSYFKDLKPSAFAILGTANPKQWAILMEFVKLVELSLNGDPVSIPTTAPQLDKPVEKMTADELNSVFT